MKVTINQDFNFSWVDNDRGFGAQFKTILCLIDYCIDQQIKFNVNIFNRCYSVTDDQNIWEVLFNQPFSDVKTDILVSDPFEQIESFSEKYWNLGYGTDERDKYLNINFIKKYRDICGKYIFIKESIISQFEDYFLKYKNKKILGVHKRGRDHLTIGHAANQSHLLKMDDIFLLIDREIDQYDYIFLTSDEYPVYSKFLKKYNEKLLTYDNKSQYNSENNLGLHFIEKTEDEKEKFLKNLLIEILILSKCNKMFLMNSNVSHMALFFSNHYNYEFYDNHLIYR